MSTDSARPVVFLSYRRGDTQWAARGIYDRLVDRYGEENVFRDLDTVPAGVRFRKFIEGKIAQSDILVLLIGKSWASFLHESGQRRLDLPRDPVRLEIETALREGIPIIPVRVEGAPMPTERDLTPSIVDLLEFNAAEVTDSRWEYDLGRLLRAIDAATEPRADRRKSGVRPRPEDASNQDQGKPVYPALSRPTWSPAADGDAHTEGGEAPLDRRGHIASTPGLKTESTSPTPPHGAFRAEEPAGSDATDEEPVTGTGSSSHAGARRIASRRPGLLVGAVIATVALVLGGIGLVASGGFGGAGASPDPQQVATGGFAPTASKEVGGLAGLDNVEPLMLAAPPFEREPPAVANAGGLAIESQESNQITDDDNWLKSNQLTLPTAPQESDVPSTYRGKMLQQQLRISGTDFLFYGESDEESILVAVGSDSRKVLYSYDFSQYVMAPEIVEADRDFVYQGIRWAEQVGAVLYVSTGHSTYAKSSNGMNAYVNAIDVKSGRLIWRSKPLVANASNFEIVGDRIVAGYGFTAESDWLYTLDRSSGEVVGGIKLKSGPEYIIEKEGSLFVRCYDQNYVVKLQ